MPTYLFVTKPEYAPECVDSGFDGPWWSCSSTTMNGDRALVYVTGRGIEYEWEVLSDAEPHEQWRYICYVEQVRTFEPPITIMQIREAVSEHDWAPPYQNFRGHKSILIPGKVADRIRRLRQEVTVADE
jgi:hypothetical protein